MKYLITAVFVLSASLCLAQQYRRFSFDNFYLAGEVSSQVVDLESQYKNEGVVQTLKFQAAIKETGTYYVAFGTITKRRTAYCKDHYATRKIEGVAGEVISGTIDCKAPNRSGFYQGPNGPEYVSPQWLAGVYKDPKDIRVGNYWFD